MKVLITGGSGFLGINCVRYLLKKNYDTRIIDLLDFKYPDVKEKVEIVIGDIRNSRDVETALKGIDIVVHTAAALPLYSKEEIFSTEIDGTRLLLRASKERKVSRFIHISSTAVYGIPNHHPIFEIDKLDGVGQYGQAKIEAERVCEEFRTAGMCVPILRPKSFIGPERLGVFALLYDWAHTGHNFPMIGKGNNRYQLLDVEDLCDAIFECMILDERVVNDTFNIGAKDFTTMKEDYQSVLDYAGHGKKIIGLPEKLVVCTLKLLEKLKLSPLYKWVYETASKDSFVSIEKAEKLLNYKPKYSNKDALLRNYKWYLENLESFKNLTGVNHRVPWKQGILKFAKAFF